MKLSCRWPARLWFISLTEGRMGDNPPPFMPGRRAAAPQGRQVEEDDLGYAFDAGGAGEEMERTFSGMRRGGDAVCLEAKRVGSGAA